MKNLICFLFMIYLSNVNAQLFDQKYYFDKCKDTYKSNSDTCVDNELKNFIYENIVKFIPNEKRNNKSKLKLNLRIESTGKIISSFLTWREGDKYYLEDVNTKVKKIENFHTAKVVSAHYTISENRSKKDSKIYSCTDQIFKVVEEMPSLDSCSFFSGNRSTCVNKKLIGAINKNLSGVSGGFKDMKNSEKIVFTMVINSDGYIGDIEFSKNNPLNNIEKRLLSAINILKNEKMRFVPGFQRDNPVDILMTVEYFFDPTSN